MFRSILRQLVEAISPPKDHLEQVETVGVIWTIRVKHEPNDFAKRLGASPTFSRFIGNGIVWHDESGHLLDVFEGAKLSQMLRDAGYQIDPWWERDVWR